MPRAWPEWLGAGSLNRDLSFFVAARFIAREVTMSSGRPPRDKSRSYEERERWPVAWIPYAER